MCNVSFEVLLTFVSSEEETHITSTSRRTKRPNKRRCDLFNIPLTDDPTLTTFTTTVIVLSWRTQQTCMDQNTLANRMYDEKNITFSKKKNIILGAFTTSLSSSSTAAQNCSYFTHFHLTLNIGSHKRYFLLHQLTDNTRVILHSNLTLRSFHHYRYHQTSKQHGQNFDVTRLSRRR